MTHDNVTDIERRLRRNSDDCSGHEPSLSLLQRTAEEAADTIATLRKQLENARSDALEEAAKKLEREWPGPAVGIVRELKGQP